MSVLFQQVMFHQRNLLLQHQHHLLRNRSRLNLHKRKRRKRLRPVERSRSKEKPRHLQPSLQVAVRLMRTLISIKNVIFALVRLLKRKSTQKVISSTSNKLIWAREGSELLAPVSKHTAQSKSFSKGKSSCSPT